MTDIRIICCDNCQTEGRILTSFGPDDIDHGECPVCEGTGGMEQKIEPLELEDFPDDGSDYMTYRGKCKPMSEALVATDPSLTLVRGYYHCPIWGEQPHWWTKKADGTVVDPTKDQFPSRGIGEYVEFDGTCQCAECKKTIKEEDADIEGNYAFCSYECHGRFVGAF